MSKLNFTQEQKLEMKAKYENGAGLKAVAEQFRVSIPTARRYIAEVGGTIRRRGRPTAPPSLAPVKRILDL